MVTTEAAVVTMELTVTGMVVTPTTAGVVTVTGVDTAVAVLLTVVTTASAGVAKT